MSYEAGIRSLEGPGVSGEKLARNGMFSGRLRRTFAYHLGLKRFNGMSYIQAADKGTLGV